MDLGGRIFELIDMRSFSNLWYWIALAALWSSISHFVLGVPYDMVGRARRHGGQAMEDLNALVHIKTRRTLMVFDTSGVWIVAFLSFLVTLVLVSGFWFGVEFAQATGLLLCPLTLVGWMRLNLSRRIATQGIHGPDLCNAITRNRFYTQLIGMGAVFVTSLWGMYQNMSIGAVH
ncbi:component of SufBCD complex [Donghicola mangrovi]|uniref:Component of SufBCD complex n=1 Tax=Donghicola mangrovi TaxID=2729614 RepID=A0A850Q9I7_9RHOB|nr:component of SufBCD complex [Donghicola mangrovi]NVO22959.1 component of SufBCD complex [Donghicola mangrovi]